MSKNKSAKYKIINTDITNDIAKKIVGKQVTVEKIRANGGNGGGKKPPKPKAPAWFVEFEKRNNQRLDKIENNVSSLRSDVNILKTNLNRVIKLNNLKH